MCRITVVVYFFTLLPSCHVQNSSQLSAGQILQCQDCMRAVKQSYSIQYIDISMFSLFASRHLQNSIQWLFNEIIHCHPYAKKCSKLIVFSTGVRGVLCCRKFLLCFSAAFLLVHVLMLTRISSFENKPKFLAGFFPVLFLEGPAFAALNDVKCWQLSSAFRNPWRWISAGICY